jgi:hypothetical protein
VNDGLKQGLFIGLIAVALSGCKARTPDKPASPSYFEKKIECQKYENEILEDMQKNTFYSQYLERIFYSPSLDTCVEIVIRNPNSGTGNRQAEVTDVLTERPLWFREYPMNGPDTKSYEEIVADADAEIQRHGWGEK